MKTVTLRFYDIDLHGEGHACGYCDARGKSYGVAVFDLSPYGITHAFQISDELLDVLAHQDPLDVFYGPSEDAAERTALASFLEQAWKLPERLPTREQLLGALQMLVGEDGVVSAQCQCHAGLAQNHPLCAFCWAKAVYEAAREGPGNGKQG